METLEKILSASADLFRQYGVKTITMDDIARRAGISKKTLYQHFANKSEVILESVSWYKNQITAQCQQTIDTSGNPVEALVRTSMFMENTYCNINPHTLMELQRFFPDAYQLFRTKMLEEDVEMIKANLQQGIDEGYYRAAINPDIMARYRLEISLLIFQPNLMVSDRYDLLRVSAELLEHFIYGLMTPKGEKTYLKIKDQYLKQVSR